MIKKKKAFTLIELLAVIVVLAVILAVAVPGISNLISSLKKDAFESDVKMIVKTIENKIYVDDDFDVTELSIDNLKNKLEISDQNYQSIRVEIIDDDTYIYVIGKNKWEGLGAYGTISDLTTSNVVSGLFPTNEACFTFNVTTGTITNYDYKNPSCPSDIVVPRIIANVNVKAIGANAFSYIGIKKLTLPEGLITIGENAFVGGQFSTITIPSSVVTIDDWAFEGGLLTNLTFASPSSLVFIGEYTFDSNQLTSLTLPNGVKTIEECAFCSNQLTSLSIPSSVTEMQGSAFTDNMLPDATAFIYGRNPDGSVNDTILSSYGGAKRTGVVVPSNVKVIEPYAFWWSSIKSVTLPTGLTTIREGAFGRNSIASIVLPSTLTTIGELAFRENKLTTLAIPNSVKIIESRAFWSNPLTSVTIDNTAGSVTLGSSPFNGLTPTYLR